MKKLLSAFLVVLLLMGVVPVGVFNSTVSAAVTDDGLTYEVTDGEVTITDFNWSESEVYIPEEIEGCPVVAISNYAFNYCGDFPPGYYGVETLHIPATVKTIEGLGTFNSSSFTIKEFNVDADNVYFSSLDGVLYNKDKTILLKYPSKKKGELNAPQGLKSIAVYALSSCSGINSINLPDSCVDFSYSDIYDTNFYKNSDNWENGILYIGNHLVKANTSLEGVVEIKPTTVSILEQAFQNCQNITSVTLPNSVRYIGIQAFYNCSNLNNITICDGVTYIGTNVFDFTGYYADLNNWQDDVLYIDDYLIKADSSISGKYKVKSNTELIANEAFYYCDRMEGIILPQGLKYIGDSAFANCSNIKEINIPKTVESIGESVFYDCYNLQSINVSEENAFYSSDEGYLYNKNKTTLIKVPEATKNYIYRVPSTVDKFENRAIDNSNLRIIIFADKNVELGEYALSYGYSIEILYIPKELTTLNENTLSNESVRHILYEGTQADWENSGYNEFNEFNSAKVCFSASADDFILTHEAAPKCGESDSDYYSCKKCNTEFTYGYEYKSHNMVMTEEFEVGCEIGKCGKYECTDCDEWYYLDDQNGTGHNFINQVCTKCGVEEGWKYWITDFNGEGNKGVLIADYTGVNPNPTVPETIEGYPVFQVAHTSFSNNNNIAAVTVPDSVTNIAYSAFKNSLSLASVALPSTIKSIRHSTFEGSDNLNHVFYGGTEEEWNAVEVSEYYNEPLKKATMHFNSLGEELEVEVITPQTCTHGGKYKLTCKICNEVFYSETTPLGHKKGDVEGEDNTATCKTPSNLLYDCTRCDYVIKEPTTNFKEHIFDSGSCTECGVLQEDCIESKHNYVSYESETWFITKPGAREIRFTLSGNFSCQAFRVYDKDHNFIEYGDSSDWNNLAGKTIVVPGDTVELEIEYSEWNEYYGFKIQYLEAIYGALGDINSDNNVNLKDLVTLAQYAANWKNLEVSEFALDVNSDGVVDLNDVTYLARYLAGWDIALN